MFVVCNIESRILSTMFCKKSERERERESERERDTAYRELNINLILVSGSYHSGDTNKTEHWSTIYAIWYSVNVVWWKFLNHLITLLWWTAHLPFIINLKKNSIAGVFSWCNGESDGLRNCSKRVHAPLALLRSLAGKYPWYEPPLSSQLWVK